MSAAIARSGSGLNAACEKASATCSLITRRWYQKKSGAWRRRPTDDRWLQTDDCCPAAPQKEGGTPNVPPCSGSYRCSEPNDDADAENARAEILRQRVETGRGEIAVPDQGRVRIEHVEQVANHTKAHHVGLERSRRPQIRVPQVGIPEGIDLRRDEYRQPGVGAERRRRALPEHRE